MNEWLRMDEPKDLLIRSVWESPVLVDQPLFPPSPSKPLAVLATSFDEEYSMVTKLGHF